MTKKEQTALEINNASLKVKDLTLFKNLNFSIKKGEFIILTGPSGVGKSSLLDWICGTVDSSFITQGSITLFGKRIENLPPEKRNIAIYYQEPLLFPHLSVGENLEIAIRGNSRKEKKEIAQDTLKNIGLKEFFHRDPLTLSGGQKARVSLMRCLLNEPKLLLLDEPFSSLDEKLKNHFRKFVVEHCQKRDLPVVLVTHEKNDVTEIKKMAHNTYEIPLG